MDASPKKSLHPKGDGPKYPLEPPTPPGTLARELPAEVRRMTQELAKELGESLWQYLEDLEESHPLGGHYEPSWDARRDKLRRVAWNRLSTKCRSELGSFAVFERAIKAFCDAALLHREFTSAPEAGPDPRGFPPRIRREAGDCLDKFATEEARTLLSHEEQVRKVAARHRQRQRGHAVHWENVPCEMLVELYESIRELQAGRWPKRSPGEAACFSPKLPDDVKKIEVVDHDTALAARDTQEARESAAGAVDAVEHRELAEEVREALERIEKRAGRSRARRYAVRNALCRYAEGRSLEELSERSGYSKSTLSEAFAWVQQQLVRELSGHRP